MRFDIVFAPGAAVAYRRLKANIRATVRDAIEMYLRHEPTKVSKRRIKRLRGLSRPQYRLRVGDIRVFYDVADREVTVLAITTKAQAESWLAQKESPMKTVALAKVKDDLSGYLRKAEREEIVITRHGRPAGVLIGFESEDDWFEYRLEHNPEFLRHIAQARTALERGQGVRLEDLEPKATKRRRRPTQR